jgi:hypothetical protein
MRIIYLLFIVISLLSAEEELYLKDYWKKLLHFEDEKSNVISDEFFLSDSYRYSLQDEFYSTIELLRGDNGKEVACNFPARYLWIKKHIEIPNYDLKSCKELNQFMDNIQKDNLYLIFSSEYPNSPSSSFGHTMIAFKDKSMPLELSDVIHFAAKTDNEDFFTYSYKGLSGKFNSYFLRTSFFQKMYIYNIKEQRYIYAYKLDFNSDEIKKIQYHLFELRKATFGYYFLNQNCASKIIDLLEISNENRIIRKEIFHLPIDTIKTYQDRVENIVKFTPLISKINYLIQKMSKDDKKVFLNIIKDNSTPSDNLSNITKETLVYYYQFLFRKYHQSYKNYTDVMRLTYKKSEIKDKSENPLKNTQPSKVGINYSDNSIEFNYMPLFLNYQDIQKNPMQEMELKLFDIKLSLQDKDLAIENIDLMSVKSLPTQYSFYHPLSWSFYLGLNRENHSNALKFQNSYGFGLSKKFLNISASILLNSGFNVSKSSIDGYLSQSFLASSYLSNDLKLGIESHYKYYFSKEYYKNELFLTKKINNLNLSIKYQNGSFDKKYIVGVSYNY